MVLRARLFALAIVLPLPACTDADWDHALSYARMAPEEPARAPVARPVGVMPAASRSASSADAFCQSVAADEATHNSFDAATRQRMAETTLRQCAALYGGTGSL